MEKMVICWRGSNAEESKGKGYLFFTVMLFSPKKSIGTESLILLLHEKWRGGGTDETHGQGLGYIFLRSLPLRLGQTEKTARWEGSTQQEVYGVVVVFMGRQRKGPVLTQDFCQIVINKGD